MRVLSLSPFLAVSSSASVYTAIYVSADSHVVALRDSLRRLDSCCGCRVRSRGERERLLPAHLCFTSYAARVAFFSPGAGVHVLELGSALTKPRSRRRRCCSCALSRPLPPRSGASPSSVTHTNVSGRTSRAQSLLAGACQQPAGSVGRVCRCLSGCRRRPAWSDFGARATSVIVAAGARSRASTTLGPRRRTERCCPTAAIAGSCSGIPTFLPRRLASC